MSTADERFEQLVSEMLEDAAPTQAPASLVPEAERVVARSRRWPAWWAGLREPPMRRGAGVVVGSATTRRMIIVAATLLLILLTLGAGIAGSSLLTAPTVIVVDPAGAGDAATITEALAMADDGDAILVRPGTYTEAVSVERDISLSGDGQREQIILIAPEGGPLHRTGHGRDRPYALLLLGVDATVQGFTLRGEASQLNVDGGAPTVRDMTFDRVGQPHTMPRGRYTFSDAVVLTQTRAKVISNAITEGGAISSFEGAPQIIDNRLSGGPSIHAYYPEADAIIAGNLVSGTHDRGIGVFGPNRMIIEDNTVRSAGGDGISVAIYSDPGNEVIVRGNTVEDTVGPALYVAPDTNPTLTGNRLCGSGDDLIADNGRFVEYRSLNELCEQAWDTIVVDQGGSADTTSIAEAIAVASDGDVILVKPGAYQGPVDIVTGVRLRADGPSGTVVLSNPGATAVLSVTASDPSVGGFVLEGDVLVSNGASPVFEQNRIAGDVALVDAGHVVLLENELWSVDVDRDSSADVLDNVFDDGRDRGTTAVKVELRDANDVAEHVVVEGNRIDGPYAYGVAVTSDRGPHIDVRRNQVRDADIGVEVRGAGPINVERNDVLGNATGIRVGADGTGSSILENLIEANGVGLHVLGAARPVVSGNHFCDNDTDLEAPEGSEVTLGHDEFCEDAAVE